jgi:hypothetical protein
LDDQRSRPATLISGPHPKYQCAAITVASTPQEIEIFP